MRHSASMSWIYIIFPCNTSYEYQNPRYWELKIAHAFVIRVIHVVFFIQEKIFIFKFDQLIQHVIDVHLIEADSVRYFSNRFWKNYTNKIMMDSPLSKTLSFHCGLLIYFDIMLTTNGLEL